MTEWNIKDQKSQQQFLEKRLEAIDRIKNLKPSDKTIYLQREKILNEL